MMAEMRMNNLGRRSVENHQLLNDSSSGSDVQEFSLPTKRPSQPRFKRKRSGSIGASNGSSGVGGHHDFKTGKACQGTDIHGCCLVLCILLFIFTVITCAWLSYVTVQLQRDVDRLHTTVDEHRGLMKKLSDADSRMTTLLNMSLTRLNASEMSNSVLRRQLDSVHNTTGRATLLYTSIKASLKASSAASGQALQGLADVQNEVTLMGSDVKATKADVDSLKAAVGPSPDLNSIPAEGEPGLQQQVHYLMRNYTWVLSQVARAKNSVHAAQQAFDTKNADLVSVQRRLAVLEGDSESTMGQVKKHHYNITLLKASLRDLHYLLNLTSVPVAVQSDNRTATSSLPASLVDLGLFGNSSVVEAIVALANMVMLHHHHGNATESPIANNTSAMIAKMDQSMATMQTHVNRLLETQASSTAPSRHSQCSCDAITLEGLLDKANVTAMVARVVTLATSAVPLNTSSELGGVIPELLALIPDLASSHSASSLSRLLTKYAQLLQRAAGWLAHTQPSSTAQPSALGKASTNTVAVSSSPSLAKATTDILDTLSEETAPRPAVGGETVSAPSAGAASPPSHDSSSPAAPSAVTSVASEAAAVNTAGADAISQSTAPSAPSSTDAAVPAETLDNSVAVATGPVETVDELATLSTGPSAPATTEPEPSQTTPVASGIDAATTTLAVPEESVTFAVTSSGASVSASSSSPSAAATATESAELPA
ncbi:mucin-19-like [Sycon ciliatum]|uniref:mucin-19-like n=1 Tax=Sycon ciliatum TaxID=27933 RepID=UPI0020AA2C1C|eukprot:scpid37260/ scgid6937/ 